MSHSTRIVAQVAAWVAVIVASMISSAFVLFELRASASETHQRLERSDTEIKTEILGRLERIENRLDAIWSKKK